MNQKPKEKWGHLEKAALWLVIVLIILLIDFFSHTSLLFHHSASQNTGSMPSLSYSPFFYPVNSPKKIIQTALPEPLTSPLDTSKTSANDFEEKKVYSYSDYKLWNGYDNGQNFQIILYNDPFVNARGLQLGEKVIAEIEDSLQSHGFFPALFYFYYAEWRVFLHPNETENQIGAELQAFNPNAYYVYNWRFFHPKPGLTPVKELVPYLLTMPN